MFKCYFYHNFQSVKKGSFEISQINQNPAHIVSKYKYIDTKIKLLNFTQREHLTMQAAQ